MPPCISRVLKEFPPKKWQMNDENGDTHLMPFGTLWLVGQLLYSNYIIFTAAAFASAAYSAATTSLYGQTDRQTSF